MLSGMISSVSGKVDTTGTNVAIDSDAVFHADADSNIAIGTDADPMLIYHQGGLVSVDD